MLLWEVVRLCFFVMFLLSFYSISVSSYKSVLLRWHQKHNRYSGSGDNVNIISIKDSFNLYMNQQNEKLYPPYIFEPIEVLTSNICDIPAKRLSNTIVLKNKYIGLRHGQSLANVEGRFHHHHHYHHHYHVLFLLTLTILRVLLYTYHLPIYVLYLSNLPSYLPSCHIAYIPSLYRYHIIRSCNRDVTAWINRGR